MLRSLEEANACFNKAKEMYDTNALKEINFNEMCDFMYNGEVDKWHRFGNSLYLRLLMRASLKAIEESNGIISLGEEFGDINVIAKINEIYDSYLSGDGTYPVMRDLMDSDSYYSSEFEYGGFDSLKACPFCGARMKK